MSTIYPVNMPDQRVSSRNAKMRSVDRIMHIPLVESGWNYAGHVYGRVKESNGMLHWAFAQAETSFNSILNTTTPVVILFQGPLSTLDKLVCQSLDVVQEKVPAINLPPQAIIGNTKQYVNNVGNRIMFPILKRADSFKQMGNSVLESKYTGIAVDTLEEALSVADKYVDIYLPADVTDGEKEEKAAYRQTDVPSQKAMKTIHHMDQFSRKLHRRLTRRTLAEAKALKHHSTEAINVLVYALDVLSNDPKLAYQKTQELWASLSEREPENQARPETLEELVILLTRESARRAVHFVNFANAFITHLPDHTRILASRCINIIDDTFKNIHMEELNHIIIETMRVRAHQFTLLLHQLNLYTTDLLEQVAKKLEQQERTIKSSPSSTKTLMYASRDGSTVHIKKTYRYSSIGNGTDNTNT